MKVENLFPELKFFIDNPKAYTVLYFEGDHIHNEYPLSHEEAERLFKLINNLEVRLELNEYINDNIKNLKINPLSLEETKLKEEIKRNCLNNSGQYVDIMAKDKFKMLCHLEDFEIEYYKILKLNRQLEDSIKRILKYIDNTFIPTPKENMVDILYFKVVLKSMLKEVIKKNEIS